MEVDGNRFRQRRFMRFLALADQVRAQDRPLKILDVGGTVNYWNALKPLIGGRSWQITVVNVDVDSSDIGNIAVRSGDACALSYPDDSFDLVHSNSVIEHVGSWTNISRMAGEVRRLAPHHFVQTPNYWFPIEPHFRTPFMHWVPENLRAQMLVNRQRGHRRADTYSDAMESVQSIRLLTGKQMKVLFPDSIIEREKVGFLTKSIIAIR